MWYMPFASFCQMPHTRHTCFACILFTPARQTHFTYTLQTHCRHTKKSYLAACCTTSQSSRTLTWYHMHRKMHVPSHRYRKMLFKLGCDVAMLRLYFALCRSLVPAIQRSQTTLYGCVQPAIHCQCNVQPIVECRIQAGTYQMDNGLKSCMPGSLWGSTCMNTGL